MRRMMEVNFIGTYLTARAALPIFRRQASGHLTIVSSIVGQRGIPAMSAYGATKAAQVGFAESLRTEFAGTAIESQHRLPGVDANRIPLRDEPGLWTSVAGLGPKQTVGRRGEGDGRWHSTGAAGDLSPCVGRCGLVLSERNRAGGFTDRLVKKYGRRRVEPDAANL